MTVKLPQSLSRSRLAGLPVAFAITATASFAAPVQPASVSAATVALGCACVILLAVVVSLLASRRRQAADSHPDAGAVIVDSARDAILVIQDTGEIVSGNPSAERLFGYSTPELLEMNIGLLIPPPAKGRRRANYLDGAGGADLIGVHKSGSRFPLDVILSELPGRAGKRLSVIVRDRSNRKPAEPEEELVEQLRFASALIDTLPSLFTVIDHEGRLVRFNRSCEELTEFSEGELRGQYLWQAVAASGEMEQAEKQVRELLAGEFPSRSQSNWCLRDNSTRTISWTHNALRDEFGRLSYIVSTGDDATYSLQKADRRREFQSLQTAGRLARGVAHDFNNLLTAISGYSGLALASLNPRDPIHNDIEEIQNASDRGAALTRQLLTFSGNRLRSPQLVNGNDLVRNVERLVRVMTGESIRFEVSLEPGLPAVYADGGLLEECLMHLAANAKEAMPNGGTLRIETGMRSVPRARIDARPPMGPGEFVTLSVEDTGCGIAPEALPHLFEPFFTTKVTPHSNGMGLAMVYGIVRQAKGSIVVHSETGTGSTFWIYLPLAPEQSPGPAPKQARGGSLCRDEGGGRP